MQCSRIISLRRATLSLTQVSCQCNGFKLMRLNFCQSSKPATTTPTKEETDNTKPHSRLYEFLHRLKIVDMEKYKTMVLGHVIYENIVDKIDYAVFYKDFNMPDTLFSWFLITELHVWMAMLRYMAEGKYGKIARNIIVEAMWDDVKMRMDKLGPIHPSVKRKQLNELSGQFNAAIITYDEGIMSNDKVLAGALWSRFLKLEGNNPELLERLIIYVRKQVNLMDKIPSKELFAGPAIKWLEFKSIR